MSTSHARVAEVAYAVQPGNPETAGEDRVVTTPNAVIVLDGATQPDPGTLGGGWLADTLGAEIRDRLAAQPTAGLRATLADSIAAVRDRHGLQPGSGPSTTVAIVRWDADTVDALVLGDSPIVTLDRAGNVSQLRDDRLAQAAKVEREALHQAQTSDERRQARRALVNAERRARNRPGGYWIAEANPTAAQHAVTQRWRANDLADVLVVTDGVSIGIDSYGSPASWTEAIGLARQDPTLLLQTVFAAEESDPSLSRWPRSKQHDDKAAAIVRPAC